MNIKSNQILQSCHSIR